LADQIHEKAAPILKWLKEADVEDSDDDDDDENEIDVVYDDRARADKIQVKDDSPPKSSPLKPAHDDELDIDAI
jgi:translation initiation factor 5